MNEVQYALFSSEALPQVKASGAILTEAREKTKKELKEITEEKQLLHGLAFLGTDQHYGTVVYEVYYDGSTYKRTGREASLIAYWNTI